MKTLKINLGHRGGGGGGRFISLSFALSFQACQRGRVGRGRGRVIDQKFAVWRRRTLWIKHSVHCTAAMFCFCPDLLRSASLDWCSPVTILSFLERPQRLQLQKNTVQTLKHYQHIHRATLEIFTRPPASSKRISKEILQIITYRRSVQLLGLGCQRRGREIVGRLGRRNCRRNCRLRHCSGQSSGKGKRKGKCLRDVSLWPLPKVWCKSNWEAERELARHANQWYRISLAAAAGDIDEHGLSMAEHGKAFNWKEEKEEEEEAKSQTRWCCCCCMRHRVRAKIARHRSKKKEKEKEEKRKKKRKSSQLRLAQLKKGKEKKGIEWNVCVCVCSIEGGEGKERKKGIKTMPCSTACKLN